MLSYYMEVLVKADKCPKLSTIGVLSAACCNILLDYIFVIKLHYGVKGAAYATVISQMLSTAIFFIHFLRKKSVLGLCKFKFDVELVKRTIKLGTPDFIADISTGVTIFIFNRVILRTIGESGIIAYTVISYTSSIVLNTMCGISQGVQPLISYNYGKKDWQAIYYYLKHAIRVAIIFSLLSYVLSILFPAQLSRLFINSNDMVLINYTINALRLYSLAYLLVGFNVVLCGFYTAVEKSKYSLIISLGRGLVVISLILMIMTYLFNDTGIWLSTFISEAICLIVSVSIFANQFMKGMQYSKFLKKLNFIDEKHK